MMKNASSYALFYFSKVKLVIFPIDLLTDKENRPEAKQLLYSLKKYMESKAFAPVANVEAKKIKALFN